MTQTNERNQRRTLRGTVTSDKMDKTITVTVDQRMKHPKYGKYVRHTRRYHAHDEQNEAGVGDVVEIAETRRLSRHKSWRLARIVERAEIV
jgi:small subunit ribosomal protein S17